MQMGDKGYHAGSDVIQAKNPAEFAEEYIIRSIWNNHFPPGSILPAERELSELIGVTRTTLREVLQRLKQDGWITIQHGKPTKVNNFWETSGLNILMTLARLDQEGMPELVDHLLSARTNIAAIYIRGAIKNNPKETIALLQRALETEDTGPAWQETDYNLHRQLAKLAGNPIYLLILNGFRHLNDRIGGLHFSHAEARDTARAFYQKLIEIAESGKPDHAVTAMREYGRDSGELWLEYRKDIPTSFVAK